MKPPDRRRIPVLLPYPFPGPFDYAPPMGVAPPPPGSLVEVPLSGRLVLGVVWDEPAARPGPVGQPKAGDGPGDGPGDGSGGVAAALPAELSTDGPPPVSHNRLRPIGAVIDAPPMPPDLRRFVDWVAGYTLTPPGLVMAMALRVNALTPPPPVAGWLAAPASGARLTPQRGKVLASLHAGPLSTRALAEAAGVGEAVVRGMAKAGLLVPVDLSTPPFAAPDADHPGPELSPAQAAAGAALRAAEGFGVTLLEGVTGSGKTEVYFEAIAQALRRGRQALVLLPEIALSAQWLQRFARRFGVQPAVWHSDLGSRRRRIAWRAVADGSARVVVGARSALFLPFPELGVIVVDEEHETAFKQEEGVTYHARDMAVVRARLADVPVVLASATPSLESRANVEAGRYRHLRLDARHGGARLPRVEAIDMRRDPPERGAFLSPVLVAAVAQTLARGEQALLFLNRRGYAPLTLCRTCGHRIACPNCTAWLVEHRARQRLACHHCGYTAALPELCPCCGAAQSLTPIGPGVERITDEAAALFPDARRLVMASDTLVGPESAARAGNAIAAREVDLVIGTQIVAKGWHFPHLTLVGVVDADLGLAGGDLRAAERTVQLLHQVAGRAGRAEAPGRVLLQSWMPEHPATQALVRGDLDGFMAREAALRRPGHWPPYGRLAALIVSSEIAAEADAAARQLARTAPSGDGIEVLGPAPAPLALLRGRHRRRLLLRTRRDIAVQPLLRAWLAAAAVRGAARVTVDVDPVSFL